MTTVTMGTNTSVVLSPCKVPPRQLASPSLDLRARKLQSEEGRGEGRPRAHGSQLRRRGLRPWGTAATGLPGPQEMGTLVRLETGRQAGESCPCLPLSLWLRKPVTSCSSRERQ